MLANILRTDRHVHRPLSADTELARAVKATARQHQEAIWARQQANNRLRSLLRDYYPQALAAFPNLAHRAPHPTPGGHTAQAGRSAQLRRPRPEDQQHPARRGTASTRTSRARSGRCRPRAARARSRTRRRVRPARPGLDHHSFPGLGPVLGARVLGELGDDPHRFTDADAVRSFAGDRSDHPCVRAKPCGATPRWSSTLSPDISWPGNVRAASRLRSWNRRSATTYAPPRPAPTSRSRSRLLRTTDRPTRRYTQTEVCVKPGTLHTVQVA
jgi:hypothetical protein